MSDKALEMLTSPEKWPRWPVLPLTKREAGVLVYGFLHTAGKPNTVYIGNVFQIPDDLEGMEKKRYATPEAILAHGWRVD